MRFMKYFSDYHGTVLVIHDYVFYAEHEEEIGKWCWQTFNYHPKRGLVMSFRNEQDAGWFLARWS